MHVPTLVFDIETIPDVEGLRRLHDISPELSDAEVAELAFQQRRARNGSDFLPHHLQRVVTISCVLRAGETFKVWSLSEPEQSEGEIIQRFFDGVEKFTPRLVSWNGGGFDLPVLHYRALLHGVRMSRYWEIGETESAFRWNNYLNRFHWRHIDLMDVLSGYQLRAVAPLDEIAVLLDLPGKQGSHGSQVWERFQAGDIEGICNYCETDVLNTYLVYLRFELMRGRLHEADYWEECRLLKTRLQAENKPHLDEFLSAWKITLPTEDEPCRN